MRKESDSSDQVIQCGIEEAESTALIVFAEDAPHFEDEYIRRTTIAAEKLTNQAGIVR